VLAVEAVLRAIKGKLHCLMESFLTDHNNVPLALISKLCVTQEYRIHIGIQRELGRGFVSFTLLFTPISKPKAKERKKRKKHKLAIQQFIALFICIY
jgi:hypothetical protein